jgi:hypothetical protein
VSPWASANRHRSVHECLSQAAGRGAPDGEPLSGRTGTIRPVAAVPLPDGQALLGSDDQTVRLWIRALKHRSTSCRSVPVHSSAHSAAGIIVVGYVRLRGRHQSEQHYQLDDAVVSWRRHAELDPRSPSRPAGKPFRAGKTRRPRPCMGRAVLS